FELSFVDFSDFVLIGNARPLGDSRCLLEQGGRRRAFARKIKTSIVINVYHDRDRHPASFAGAFVELLYELAEVDTKLTQRSTHRRRRSRLPAGNLKFRCSYKLLCHVI